jgi:hypothetical protein
MGAERWFPYLALMFQSAPDEPAARLAGTASATGAWARSCPSGPLRSSAQKERRARVSEQRARVFERRTPMVE